ncbi:MAG: efflux RND transporter permease subunit [Fimbriiglobus sp.]
MNPIIFALRHPVTILVGIMAMAIGSLLAMSRVKVDIFPNLNQPVIYICQPYGGMSPQQMEGLLTNYYEFHFLYVNGIHHVESKNIQSMTLIKLYFHPGTDMAQAMAETVAAVNRARFMMPPGTVPPFVTRLDVGSASVGYLVLSSDKLAIKDIQDQATLKIRPMFASIPGVSSPPAFGGNQRAIVVSMDPDKLRAQQVTLDQITDAVTQGNTVSPTGNLRFGDRMFLVNTNAMVGTNPKEELGRIPVKLGENPVFLRDVATIDDSSDITAGYVLVDGRRSVYMLVTKKSDASTLSVVSELQKALPKMRDAAPDMNIEFAFDQSPIVTNAMLGVGLEGAIGALLTGLMVLLFLRDWRSVIVVVLNIPLALLAAILALWVTGVTINLMSLGGLALAVGILVDEATVEVENIHAQMAHTPSVARAVRRGNQETAVPRLLAMLCILAVFIPSFFMEGAARELFVPLSLAVGFAMIASYLLSSTFVPVLCVKLLKPMPHGDSHGPIFGGILKLYTLALGGLLRLRWLALPAYLAGMAAAIYLLTQVVGTGIFPPSDQGMFTLRLKAPPGTRIERTEELTQLSTKFIQAEAGEGGVKSTVGYVGMFPTNYPIQAVHQWTSGPDEAILKVALNPSLGISVPDLKARLRDKLEAHLQNWLAERWQEENVPAITIEARKKTLRLSFEPGDLVSEVMSFGSPTPIEVQITSPRPADNLAHAKKILEQLRGVPNLKDLQITQTQDYPTVDINLDREKAAFVNLSARQVSNAMIPATASSRYMNPIYWRDPGSGQGYIVQVQIPPPRMLSSAEVGLVPIRGEQFQPEPTGGTSAVLLRDVAAIRETTTPGQIDRYNMRRMISITGNITTADLGQVGRDVKAAIKAAGDPPKGVNVDLRGQIETLDGIFRNLAIGLGMAVVTIALLLMAYYQSVRLALVSVAAVPATLAGVGLALLLTQTTLNLQSFMGAIMAIGVAVANAILLVTFAERERKVTGNAREAARLGATSRLRPILMTSCAMAAGMVPMALGLGEGGDQAAPLGRAVLGGVIASTLATLFALPAVFATVMTGATTRPISLDPDDPTSPHFDGPATAS